MASFRAHGVHVLAGPLLIGLILVACSAAPGTGGPPRTPAGFSTGAGLEAATTILNAAKLADAESLGKLEGIRFSAAGIEAAAAVLAAGATGDALWAATYVYASSGTDPAPLLAVAASTSASATVRAMAGAALVSLGEVKGFDALIAGLGSTGAMEGAEPAQTVWEFAAGVLERYTSGGIAAPTANDEAARTMTTGAWTTWLAANRDHLRFDAPTHTWIAA